MLSIAKLRVGAEAYQLTGVAQSLDDYYSGSGEAEGWWAGEGARELGLDGVVAGEDLRAVLAGLRPGGGGLTPNGESLHAHPRRVPGFDLTFKAPKSVSVLYAVSDDPRVQGAIIEACEAAVRDTIAWLERDVVAVRRGTGNERYLADLATTDPGAAEAARIRSTIGAEVAAAVFRHRTSRAGDPLLHWHVLVPNLVRGSDGRWSAFVHPDLYRSAKAAGELFQASLRHELTERLGVDWRQGRHVGEIDGVPQAACDGFSKRSKEIDAWLDANGRSADRAGRQDAVLATRRGKAELEGERFDARWKVEAELYGFGPAEAERLICRREGERTSPVDESFWRLPESSIAADGAPYRHDRVVDGEAWIADLLRNDLCVADATFNRSQMLAAIASRLGDGATVATVEAIANRAMASPQVLPVSTSDTRVRRWTSVEMASTERRLLDSFVSRDLRQPLERSAVAALIAAHPNLGTDQRDAVEGLAAAVTPVSVMIGPAGTGKTYTLAVARSVYEASGLHLVGTAPSARAAAELEDGAGIDAHTLHALALRWRDGRDLPDQRTVLVVDEAAMASTRDLEPLVNRTVAAGGRVVLVGDHHQMPEVTAGGGLAAAIATVDTVVELTVNRRQHQEWERHALADLRNGSVAAAVDAYRANGRVTVVGDDQNVVTVAVDRYIDALERGLQPVLMAGTNDMVNRLNDAVRQRLVARGAIAPAPSTEGDTAGRRYRVGERVVLRRNRRLDQPDGTAVAVRNSDAAIVVRSEGDSSIVVRRLSDQALIALDPDYAAQHVAGGYAVTAHRAQGGTWDLAIAVGADGLYREAAYVQMSRGRASNELIIPAPQMAELDAELARHDRGIPLPEEVPPEAVEDLLDRITRSRAKQMALTRDPDADRIGELARTNSVADLEQRARWCRTVERTATATIGIEPTVLAAAIERAERTARHVQVGQRVKAYDRQNIGTVVGHDDTGGTMTVLFRSRAGNEAVRVLPWTEVEIVDADLGPERILPAIAQQRLAHLVAAGSAAVQRWHERLASAGVEPGEATRCERARDLVVDRSAAMLAARSPEWLLDLLGPRPSGPHDASIWDHAVRAVAEQRTRTGVPDTEPGLGIEPIDSHARRHWQIASRQILEARCHLDSVATVRDLGPWPLLPSRAQLDQRLEELDVLLASAPPDQRDLLARLRGGGQLSLLDTTEVLRAALDGEGARRDWILANWPHVVEYAEIDRAIDNRSFGPDLAPLRDHLLRATDCAPLVEAIERGDVWVDRALCRLVGDSATTVSSSNRDTIEQLAQYRERWGVAGVNPVGPAPFTGVQRDDLLTIRLELVARETDPADRRVDSLARPAGPAEDESVALGL